MCSTNLYSSFAMSRPLFSVLDETKIPAHLDTAVYTQCIFLVKETLELGGAFIMYNSRDHHSHHTLMSAALPGVVKCTVCGVLHGDCDLSLEELGFY